MNDRSPILLYDGSCGFCARSVQFVLDHERERRFLRFTSLQSDLGDALRRHDAALAAIDSVIWYEAGDRAGTATVFVRSDAVIRVLRYLGGGWSALAAAASIVPRPVRDWIYDLVARHRRRLLRSSPSCLMPTPAQRARFLD
jgi:predicted DCC family thiol-disulfide oxidoreductase YuxK